MPEEVWSQKDFNRLNFLVRENNIINIKRKEMKKEFRKNKKEIKELRAKMERCGVSK